MRFAAVLDGTIGTVAQQAQALGAFLREGLAGDLPGETLILYHDEDDRDPLVRLAPTRDVRLLRTLPRRPDLAARSLETAVVEAGGGPVRLVLFAPGSSGAEHAARLALRTGGSVMTEALSVEAGPERLLCRRSVYSGHLVGRFELSARPWCVSLDAGWGDGRSSGPGGEPGASSLEHQVLSATDETITEEASPFDDLEVLEAPSIDDLAESRFLVVAGYGAGSREGVERIAAAAGRMGAAFGVSRPVVMNAWAPMDRLVGVSGTRAAPALCIVVGASGSPALHRGIEKAGFIVAVNPDDQAPMVAHADVAVLGDGVAVMEALAGLVLGGNAAED